MIFELIDQVPCANILGEGVQWNHRDQSVWWVDIKANKIFRYHLATKNLQNWDTPEAVGCFAFVENDPRIIVALATGFAWFDLATSEHEWIARPELHLAGNRLNDGRVDRQGRFWVGSIVENKLLPNQSASLFCLDTQQKVTQHLTDLTISNSLCWNLDSTKIYHADSPTQQMHVYNFDVLTGNLSNKKLFFKTVNGVDPDGACVDAENFVWNAQWGGSHVLRYSPNGDVDRRLKMIVSQPTCVAFGGEDMDLLFITSARIGLTDENLVQQPAAGDLFIYRTDIKGVQENWYKKS